MSRTRMFIIECDECGDDITELFANEATRKAREEGWKLGFRDICPDCQGEA